MAKILLKKSYLHKNLKKISYNNLLLTKGVFTTIRIKDYPPKFILLKEHIKNLNLSIKKLNIQFYLSEKIFNMLIEDLFKNKIKYDHLLRIAVNNKIISLNIRKRQKYSKYFTGILVNYQRPNYLIKNLHYKKIINIMKNVNQKNHEVILTKKNKILEGCTTNIIFCKNSDIFLPRNGFYPGITLKFIKTQTKRKIIVKDIKIDEIKSFDEIILVGSGKGVVGLQDIPQINWKKKKDKMCKELQGLYNSYIDSYIET